MIVGKTGIRENGARVARARRNRRRSELGSRNGLIRRRMTQRKDCSSKLCCEGQIWITREVNSKKKRVDLQSTSLEFLHEYPYTICATHEVQQNEWLEDTPVENELRRYIIALNDLR